MVEYVIFDQDTTILILSTSASCTIVLPCYNPQPFWAERVVSKYNLLQEKLPKGLKLILVNDGSTQNVSQQDVDLINESIPFFEYISYTNNRGKGYALRQGVAKTLSDIVIYTDIDFPYSVDSILAIFNQLNAGHTDIALGVKNDQYYNKVPPIRRHISRILRSMIGVFFNIPVTDTQCGLKGFNKEGKLAFLDTEIERYLFDLEFIHMAYKRQLQITPIEVELNDLVVFRSMNYKLLLPEAINFLKIILRR